MTNKMNINVSGGTGAFGAVSQGNAACVSGTVTVTQEEVEHRFRSTEQALRALAESLGKTHADVDAALARMTALKERALSNPGNVEEGATLLKTVRENFSWAYPAIKDFAQAVWPLVTGAS
ncbi:hypothetical protein [Noviherbaspirillum sp. ST9]|uniref:hypothetical protein n=1 Tax=Noviherbaspirillum sp. ST9 TaxID=3401606 RepID=UPI003B5877CD